MRLTTSRSPGLTLGERSRTSGVQMVAVACLSMATCQGSVNEVDIIHVEPNALDILEIEIESPTDGDDHVLDVRGVADSGDVIASAVLRTGVDTELIVSVGDETRTYTIVDGESHTLAEPEQPALAAFVHLEAVAS